MWHWGLSSGGCWVLGTCQGFETQDSFIFLLTYPSSSCWHRVIQVQGTSGVVSSPASA